LAIAGHLHFRSPVFTAQVAEGRSRPLSLPFAPGEGAVEGVSVGATLVKEGIASGIEWVGDHLVEDAETDPSVGTGAGSEAPSDAGVAPDEDE
jgi:hypothetical protein